MINMFASSVKKGEHQFFEEMLFFVCSAPRLRGDVENARLYYYINLGLTKLL
ncbi:hypothetical protein HanIR_Chr09g0437811 [Helianthus annuus]|nr:hypothetical protein HanIR_Chr09g0437811 [Helianthus annuus]